MSEFAVYALLAILAVCTCGMLWISVKDFRDARRKIRARQAEVAARIDQARGRQ